MERPKTYGEFAEMNEYTRVDERLRDREISDDAWRVLNMHNEIPDVVKKHFDMQDVTVSYVDYYDDNNVAIVATTKDCYEPIMMSAIVGDKFEASVDCLLESDRWDVEYKFGESVDSMFEKLSTDLIGGIKRDIFLRSIDFQKLDAAVKYDPELVGQIDADKPWLRRNYQYPGLSDEKVYAYIERLHRQLQSRLEPFDGLDIYRYEHWDGDYNIGLRLDASWPNPEREGELLRRRFQIGADDGHIYLYHEDDVIYTNHDTEIPLDIQYHSNCNRVGEDIPYTPDTLHDTVEAVMKNVDTLLANPPVRETILPTDLEILRDLRLSNVSPHAAEMIGLGNERLYIYADKGEDGLAESVSAEVLTNYGDKWYKHTNTYLRLEQLRDSVNWRIHLKSDIGEGVDSVVHVTDPSEREAKMNDTLRTFGEFIETEYSKSIVSDLDNQNEIQQ